VLLAYHTLCFYSRCRLDLKGFLNFFCFKRALVFSMPLSLKTCACTYPNYSVTLFLLRAEIQYSNQAFPYPVRASVVWSIAFMTIKHKASKTIKRNISKSEIREEPPRARNSNGPGVTASRSVVRAIPTSNKQVCVVVCRAYTLLLIAWIRILLSCCQESPCYQSLFCL